MIDPVDLAIEPIAEPRRDDLRRGLSVLDEAIAGDWPATNGFLGRPDGRDGVGIMPPWSQFIGAAPGWTLDREALRALRAIAGRALGGDLAHPRAADFPLAPGVLAAAIAEALATRLAPAKRARILVIEHPNPFGPIRAVVRTPGGTGRVAPLLDDAASAILSTLAPPSIGLFATSTSVHQGHLVDMVSLSPVVPQTTFPVRDLGRDPVATMRALALLESHGYRP